MEKHYAIAIDGPSGAGKSSMARRLAEKYGFIYVDTGAIYRSLALAAVRNATDRKDEAQVMELLKRTNISIGYNDVGEQRMYLNGEDVSETIRKPEVSVAASDVSAHAKVREYLLEMQRRLARENNVVMDGRDIGTVVLPDAAIKIFLTASAQARATRRLAELNTKGVVTSFDEVLKDIEYRDAQDTERAAAPLKKADGAVTVDTSELNFEESLERLSMIVDNKLKTC